MTSTAQKLYACAVAFDLDLRKNWEPELVEEFGDPVIAIPNLNEALRDSSVYIGTSNSASTTGMQSVLDWFQGTLPFKKNTRPGRRLSLCH